MYICILFLSKANLNTKLTNRSVFCGFLQDCGPGLGDRNRLVPHLQGVVLHSWTRGNCGQ